MPSLQCKCRFECGTSVAFKKHLDFKIRNPDVAEHALLSSEELPPSPAPRKGSIEAIQAKRRAAAAIMKVPFKCSCGFSCGSQVAWEKHASKSCEGEEHTLIEGVLVQHDENGCEVDSPEFPLRIARRKGRLPVTTPPSPHQSLGVTGQQDDQNLATPPHQSSSPPPRPEQMMFVQTNPMWDEGVDATPPPGENSPDVRRDALYTPLSASYFPKERAFATPMSSLGTSPLGEMSLNLPVQGPTAAAPGNKHTESPAWVACVDARKATTHSVLNALESLAENEALDC
ncbi:hypothetical protein CYMTET_9599 [Cymbomonas tetramitiformis]|uniref:Uncharacterized protein n=1 Tax=Cymbomonas tetramitiformis TaxID=36881 RepID=A0AAE0GR59_9CHLO|nr:hypothetical protein CYMTET_53405 [Cymbomonas tetramitiformis]KAK3282673.1 hypothetical protein CYMTET_9599 [Cymbomonas tetramitiformis]